MRNYKKEFIDLITKECHRHNIWTKFGDFCIFSSTAISNSVDVSNFNEREDLYMKTMKKYRKEEAQVFPKLLAIITEWLSEEYCDALGEIYMELALGSKHMGQFFTPYHVCKLMSEVIFDKDKIEQAIKEKGKVTLSEPAVGAGANVIAFAEAMKDNGYNYQKLLEVDCNDIDINPIMMAYIQLSLLGIPAIIKHQNTLTLPEITHRDVWITPTYAINNFMVDTRKLHELRVAKYNEYNNRNLEQAS